MKESKGICPIQKIAELLSDTWTMLIIRDLLASKARFCELEESLAGISTRTLTLKLKTLADQGIVEKNDMHYSLSKQGKKLRSVIDAMAKVGVRR